jgi:colanic acid biosynthesis glycosyl transferase WcaI
MSRAKIVFVNRYYAPDESATSQLLTDLAESFAADGFVVQVICSRQRYENAAANLEASSCLKGVSVLRVWTTRFGRARLVGRAIDYGTFYMSSALALLLSVKAKDLVIVKTDPPLICIVAWLVCKLKGAALINWLQDLFPEVASASNVVALPRAMTWLLAAARDACLRAARVNVVLGERMLALLTARGIAAERLQVIPNWSAPIPSPVAVESSRLRASLGLRGHFVIGYSGNLGRAHEFDTLLSAARRLQTDTKITFLMIGGGAKMVELQRQVEEQGLGNFRFLPYQSRDSLADSLAAADVHWVSLVPALEGLIVPSKYYGILAAARPVVFIGDLQGELARDIERSHCGSSVAIGDDRALADLLLQWRSDPASLQRMGANGREHCQRHYSREAAVTAWRQILRLARSS